METGSLQEVHRKRMAENLDIPDFAITDAEMAAIAGLDTVHSLFFDHHDGEVAKMFMGWRSLV